MASLEINMAPSTHCSASMSCGGVRSGVRGASSRYGVITSARLTCHSPGVRPGDPRLRHRRPRGAGPRPRVSDPKLPRWHFHSSSTPRPDPGTTYARSPPRGSQLSTGAVDKGTGSVGDTPASCAVPGYELGTDLDCSDKSGPDQG